MHSLLSGAPRFAAFLASLLAAAAAQAQAPAPVAPPIPPPAAPAAPTAPTAPTTPASEAAETAPAPASPELEHLKSELEETKKQVAELKAAQEEAAAAAATSDTQVAEQEKLKVYGFADVGFQYVQLDKSSLLANVYDVNHPDFVLGNLNLYFDAQPIDNWRGLVEVRFTNAPQGKITNFGGIGGKFTRASTFTDDSSGAALNAPLWGGSVVIERAWLEYNKLQALKLRVGNWFTPFGIWNEDHGTPTLISLAWPQFMTQRWMPLRQTGVMLYGNTFAGSWELGYAATLSNGRQEDANLNIDGRLGYGGRLYARRETGEVNSTFGVSFFTGKTRDRVVDVIGVDPITFRDSSTFEYNEYVMGADAALDVGRTRVRAEGVVRRVTYTPGKRQLLNQVLQPEGQAPDKWEHSAYLLVAQQLPGDTLDMFEPFLWGEALQTPTIVGDGAFVASAGLNVRFNPAITWKNQVSHIVFFDWLYDSPYDNSKNNIDQFYSRLVMAF
jgi:hypothetical protein